jgi:hypothetical protein
MSAAEGSSIYVATPCYGGLVTTQYMLSVLALRDYAAANGFAADVFLLGRDSLVTRSRNTLVADFMTGQGATHLMFIDADIGFEPAQVQRMLDLDEDIVAGMYPAKTLDWSPPARIAEREPPQTAALNYVGKFCARENLEVKGSFATGEYCGTGFMLIKREAIARMIAAYPETAYGSDHVHVSGPDGDAAGGGRRALHALFECAIDPDTREYLSEDFGFCRRWRAIGGKIWLDLEGALTHTGVYDFVGNPAARYGRR